MQRVKKKMPFKALTFPIITEIAEACLYLASDRSSYVTGVALEVTGKNT